VEGNRAVVCYKKMLEGSSIMATIW